jgi:hypothetical protein
LIYYGGRPKVVVLLIFHGILAGYFGVEEARFELADGARYRDLLSEIGRVYGGSLPPRLWDRDRKIFMAPVLAMKNGRKIFDTDEPLEDGSQITFFLMLAGG